MTSLQYNKDSTYPSSPTHPTHSMLYSMAPSFPPSPSAYVIDPMSPTATFGAQSHNFPTLFTSNFSLPPSVFTDPSDGLSSMPPLDDEPSLPSLLASPMRLPSTVSVSDSSESSSLSGLQSPVDSPFILPPTDSSGSPSFSSSSVTSVSPPPGKRRRVNPLTKEQRAAINKAKHKEIDAARRQREATVVKQLQRLTRQKHEREEYASEDEQEQQPDVDEGDEDDDVDGEGRRDKVTVLEESATTIAQLRALCRRMRRACNAKDRSITNLQKHLNAIAVAKTQALNASKSAATDSISALSDPASTASLLSFLPESTSQYLSQLDRSHVLYTSTFVRSPLALVLVAIPSGISLDVNEVFERSTGWKRQDIVGTLIGPPADGSRPKHPLNPMVLRRRKDGKSQLRDGEDEDDGWWTRRYLRQYPSSKLSMKEVWRGESKKVEVVWRVVMADGSIYESDTRAALTVTHPHILPTLQSPLTSFLLCLLLLIRTMYTIWLADADWVSDGQGGYELRPHQMVLASAYGDAVRVDEWDKEDSMPYTYSCNNNCKAQVVEESWKRRPASRGVRIDNAS